MVCAPLRSQASLDHRGIVKMFGFVASPAMCVMEYMPDGQLDKFLATQIDISYAKRAEILLEVASGLAYLHRMGVVHVRHPSACAKCMACFAASNFTFSEDEREAQRACARRRTTARQYRGV